MPSETISAPSLTRRSLLTGLGAGAGLLLTGGLPKWMGGAPLASLDQRACLRALAESLSPAQRERIVLPWDHPSRQLTNTISLFKGPHMETILSGPQMSLVERLYETMTSARGHADLAPTVGLEGGGIGGNLLTLYGSLGAGGYASATSPLQAMIHGGHLQIRSGGETAEGEALGGPIAYGQQLGNGRFRIEGNAFAFHSDRINEFHATLDAQQRARVVVERVPHQLAVQLQGVDGVFAGLPARGLSDASKASLEGVLRAVLGTYPEAAAAEARDTIEANGGLDSLHVSLSRTHAFFEDGESLASLGEEGVRIEGRPAPYFQVWRVEGPGTVIHFQGSPHVHAYVNMSRDPSIRYGEVLAEADRHYGPEALRGLVESSLRRETGAPWAFYGDQLPARFCPGAITTGLAWALDPFQNRIAVAEIEAKAAAPPLRASLERQGARLEGRVRVATVGYFGERWDLFGEPRTLEIGDRYLREAVTDYLRAEGLRWPGMA